MFILPIFLLPQIGASTEKVYAEFVISSKCVTSVELINNDQSWDLAIIINDISANKMKVFSNKNIQRLVSITNGNGVTLYTAKIQGEISNHFLIKLNNSKPIAQKFKKYITGSMANCGIIKK